MSINENVYYEEYTLKFEGGSADTHEIDLDLLADSLKAFNKLVEKTNKAVNSKKIDIKVKAKAGLREGSVEIELLIGYVLAAYPLVPVAIDHVKSAVTMIKDVIEVKKFLFGKPPTSIAPAEGGISISNVNGDVTVITNPVYNLNMNSGVSVAIDNVFAPLESSIGKMSIIPKGTEVPPTIVANTEKQYLRVMPAEDFRTDIEGKELEVLTTNLDGKADKWRFYDSDADCDYSAHINDANFLRNVSSGMYNFQRGDVLVVNMSEVKKDSGKRKTTDRFIQNVISHNRPEAPAESE